MAIFSRARAFAQSLGKSIGGMARNTKAAVSNSFKGGRNKLLDPRASKSMLGGSFDGLNPVDAPMPNISQWKAEGPAIKAQFDSHNMNKVGMQLKSQMPLPKPPVADKPAALRMENKPLPERPLPGPPPASKPAHMRMENKPLPAPPRPASSSIGSKSLPDKPLPAPPPNAKPSALRMENRPLPARPEAPPYVNPPAVQAPPYAEPPAAPAQTGLQRSSRVSVRRRGAAQANPGNLPRTGEVVRNGPPPAPPAPPVASSTAPTPDGASVVKPPRSEDGKSLRTMMKWGAVGDIAGAVGGMIPDGGGGGNGGGNGGGGGGGGMPSIQNNANPNISVNVGGVPVNNPQSIITPGDEEEEEDGEYLTTTPRTARPPNSYY